MERSAHGTADALHNIASILQTGLDKRTTTVLTELLEAGVDPGSLSDVIVEVRQQTKVAAQNDGPPPPTLAEAASAR